VRPTLVAAIALLSAGSLPLPAVNASGLRAGTFLYAAPDIRSPGFTQSVVLLVQHGPEGSLGLVVNRPTRTPVGEVLKELGAPPDLALHFGGPVQTGALLGLVRSPSPVGGAARVLPDVYFSSEVEPLKAAARAPDAKSRLRVYAGYAGWAPGQLAEEVRQAVWVLGPADARSVFSSEPETLWPLVHDLLRRIEVRFITGARMAMAALPGLNLNPSSCQEGHPTRPARPVGPPTLTVAVTGFQ
jgi:putative transcriptional regulator